MTDEANGPDDRPWVGITANPGSGLGRGRVQVERFVEALRDNGLAALVAWTPADRRALVSRSGSDPRCRCLVAVGGDGTVAALLNDRPKVPVLVLPTGTENLFARHFGMGPDPKQAAEVIRSSGRPLRIDLGETPDYRFALMAGIGFDADVVARHHRARLADRGQGRARPTHRAAYVVPVLQSSLAYRFPRLTVTITDPPTGEVLEGRMAFLFNLPRYALGLPIAPDAVENDGWLDLVTFPKPGPFRALGSLWEVLRGRHIRPGGAEHRRVRAVSVVADEPVPVQLDGDPCGTIPRAGPEPPWTASVLPSAVELLVPRSYRPAARSAVETPLDLADPVGRPSPRTESPP